MVERVLNGRGGVRSELTQKLLAATRALDYPRRLPELHRGILPIEVIHARPETTFFSRLSGPFTRIAATLDASVAVHRTGLYGGRRVRLESWRNAHHEGTLAAANMMGCQ